MQLHYNDIDDLIKETKQAWADQMVGSIARIDFKDYSPFKKYLESGLEDLKIKAVIDYSFLGIKIDFIRS